MKTRSEKEFHIEHFLEKSFQPMIDALVLEIEKAFDLLEHLKGFTCFDPEATPENEDGFRSEEINKLAMYYGSPLTSKGESFPPLINGIALEEPFPVYKTFVCMQS